MVAEKIQREFEVTEEECAIERPKNLVRSQGRAVLGLLIVFAIARIGHENRLAFKQEFNRKFRTHALIAQQ
jgi:hypothetical protein